MLRLVDSLRQEGIIPREGVTIQMLEDFEAKYQVRLPADLRAYFTAFDGMDEDEYTSAHFRFWPLSSVRPVALDVEGASGDDLAGYFSFADVLICSHEYAVKLRGEGANQIVIAGGRKPAPKHPKQPKHLGT